MRIRNPEPFLAATTAVLGTAATLLGLLLVDSSAAVVAPGTPPAMLHSGRSAALRDEHPADGAPRIPALETAPTPDPRPELPYGDHAHAEGARCGLSGARAETPRDDPNFTPTREHYEDVVAGEFGFLNELGLGDFRSLCECDLWWMEGRGGELRIEELLPPEEREWELNAPLRARFAELQELRNEFMFWRDREESFARWKEHETQTDLRAAMEQQFTRVAAAAGERSRRLRDVQLALGRAGTSDALDLCPSYLERRAAEQSAWERVWSAGDCERPEPRRPGAPRE